MRKKSAISLINKAVKTWLARRKNILASTKIKSVKISWPI
jgi:hypothetical protein